MSLDLDAASEFSTPRFRAAAQAMLALATLDGGYEDGEHGVEVTIADGKADKRGRLLLYGERVDAADAIVAGSILLTDALKLMPAADAAVLRRILGVIVAWAEAEHG